MKTPPSSTMPWVLFRLCGTTFGMDITYVREMLPLPKVRSLPSMPSHVRGVVDLRGSVMPVVDMRVLLNMRSLEEECTELIGIMNQREQDHLNWLKELEACVHEDREFRLATDPHKCAFGRWFDTFKTHSTALAMQLMRFDTPHKAIHAIAAEVIGMRDAGYRDAAQDIIIRARKGSLANMVRLFGEFRDNVRELQRELAIVVQKDDRFVVMTADSADSVEFLQNTSDHIPGAEMGLCEALVNRVARREKDQSLVLLPDVAKLFEHIGE